MKNPLINYYFVFKENYQSPRLFKNSLAIEPDDFYSIVTDPSRKEKLNIIEQVLYFQFDNDNNHLYSPNARSFPKEIYNNCKQTLIDKIKKDYKKTVNSAIRTDAQNSFTVKKISNYGNLVQLLKEVDNVDIINNSDLDISVYEFNGSKFPITVKNTGGKICYYAGPGMDFVYTENGKHYKIYTTKSIGIFLDVDKVKTWGDKSLYILNGFRTFYSSLFPENQLDPFFYRVKNMLELGYDIKNICSSLYRNVNNFDQFDELTEKLLDIYKSIDDDFLLSSKKPYYYSFRIDFSKTQLPFVGRLKQNFRAFKYKDYLSVLDYDYKNDYIVIESNLYFPDFVFEKIFGTKDGEYTNNSSLMVAKYNSVTGNINVLTGTESIKNSLIEGGGVSKIKAFVGLDEEKSTSDLSLYNASEEQSRFMTVVDFPKAYSFILKICNKLNFDFVDIPVVLLNMDKSTLGGYVSKGQPSSEIVPGISLSPPFILINKNVYPNPEDQIGFIIHEYRHYIYNCLKPDSTISYNKEDMGSQDEAVRNKGLRDYYVNEDEYNAHLEEFVFYLEEGRSPEDILETVINSKKISRSNLYQAQLAEKIMKDAIKIVQEKESERKL